MSKREGTRPFLAANIAVLTVSGTGTPGTDTSGQVLAKRIVGAATGSPNAESSVTLSLPSSASFRSGSLIPASMSSSPRAGPA
jgi:hypothetical protein